MGLPIVFNEDIAIGNDDLGKKTLKDKNHMCPGKDFRKHTNSAILMAGNLSKYRQAVRNIFVRHTKGRTIDNHPNHSFVCRRAGDINASKIKAMNVIV